MPRKHWKKDHFRCLFSKLLNLHYIGRFPHSFIFTNVTNNTRTSGSQVKFAEKIDFQTGDEDFSRDLLEEDLTVREFLLVPLPALRAVGVPPTAFLHTAGLPVLANTDRPMKQY